MSALVDSEGRWEDCHHLGFGGVGLEHEPAEEPSENGAGSTEPLDVGSCDEAIVGIEGCQSVSDSQS